MTSLFINIKANIKKKAVRKFFSQLSFIYSTLSFKLINRFAISLEKFMNKATHNERPTDIVQVRTLRKEASAIALIEILTRNILELLLTNSHIISYDVKCHIVHYNSIGLVIFIISKKCVACA